MNMISLVDRQLITFYVKYVCYVTFPVEIHTRECAVDISSVRLFFYHH